MIHIHFHPSSQDGVCLYGVFDGHDGSRASNFAAQRMPAELLLGQLAGKTTDEEIKEVLYQVWSLLYHLFISNLIFIFLYEISFDFTIFVKVVNG